MTQGKAIWYCYFILDILYPWYQKYGKRGQGIMVPPSLHHINYKLFPHFFLESNKKTSLLLHFLTAVYSPLF